MRTHITLLSLLATLCASAQFNTIATRPTLYSVETVSEVRENDTPIEAAELPSEQSDSISPRQQWISQYLSVSLPLDAVTVTSPFSKRADPFTGKTSTHKGLDLRANYQEVYSMLPGTVIKVGENKRSGIYVTMRHADYTVSYCHLSKAMVSKGDLVEAGQPLAITGSTGRSTAPHLHLILRRGRTHLNPQILLDYIALVRSQALTGLLSQAE